MKINRLMKKITAAAAFALLMIAGAGLEGGALTITQAFGLLLLAMPGTVQAYKLLCVEPYKEEQEAEEKGNKCDRNGHREREGRTWESLI